MLDEGAAASALKCTNALIRCPQGAARTFRAPCMPPPGSGGCRYARPGPYACEETGETQTVSATASQPRAPHPTSRSPADEWWGWTRALEAPDRACNTVSIMSWAPEGASWVARTSGHPPGTSGAAREAVVRAGADPASGYKETHEPKQTAQMRRRAPCLRTWCSPGCEDAPDRAL